MIRINLASLNSKYELTDKEEDVTEYELTITLGDKSARISLRRGAMHGDVVVALRKMADIFEETL